MDAMGNLHSSFLLKLERAWQSTSGRHDMTIKTSQALPLLSIRSGRELQVTLFFLVATSFFCVCETGKNLLAGGFK